MIERQEMERRWSSSNVENEVHSTYEWTSFPDPEPWSGALQPRLAALGNEAGVGRERTVPRCDRVQDLQVAAP
jgi:hypothetical protein